MIIRTKIDANCDVYCDDGDGGDGAFALNNRMVGPQIKPCHDGNAISRG